jgi:ketosteroid isomerase-like protein
MSTPSIIVDRLLRDITSGEWDRLPSLYAPNAVVELPFAGAGGTRLTGREEIAAHFERARHAPFALRLTQLMIHETTDPEVVVAEYMYDATSTTNERSTRLANIQVVRVRGGLIVSSRDYHDRVAIMRLVG